MPSTCEKTLATSWALCLLTLPSNPYLVLYTHLHLTSFLPLGRGKGSQVSLEIEEEYYSFIVAYQSIWPETSSNVYRSNSLKLEPKLMRITRTKNMYDVHLKDHQKGHQIC